MPGQNQIGEYKLIELAGEGSFGKVWKARRTGSLQTVAVKLITKHGKNEKDLRNLRQVRQRSWLCAAGLCTSSPCCCSCQMIGCRASAHG
jgi:serine/threonine protein kinase